MTEYEYGGVWSPLIRQSQRLMVIATVSTNSNPLLPFSTINLSFPFTPHQ